MTPAEQVYFAMTGLCPGCGHDPGMHTLNTRVERKCFCGDCDCAHARPDHVTRKVELQKISDRETNEATARYLKK